MKTNQKPVIMYYPSVTYDLAQFMLFPLNYLISGLCHLQPEQSIWNEKGFQEKELLGSGSPLSEIKNNILDKRDIAYNEEDLVRLYDSLPTLRAQEDLTGRSWRGKILRTNASVLDLAEWAIIRPLNKIGIEWGKRYRDQHKGDPLLMRWRERIYFPIPIWGNVGMTDIAWRGKLTATMNYDHQPWKDYFRLLSNDNGEVVLLGVWTHKHIAGGWFTLTLDKDVSDKFPS